VCRSSDSCYDSVDSSLVTVDYQLRLFSLRVVMTQYHYMCMVFYCACDSISVLAFLYSAVEPRTMGPPRKEPEMSAPVS
jgi:hypothetical protein